MYADKMNWLPSAPYAVRRNYPPMYAGMRNSPPDAWYAGRRSYPAAQRCTS